MKAAHRVGAFSEPLLYYAQTDEIVLELQQEADDESQTLTTEAVMREIMLDADKFPSDALEGHWI